jgi:hypothetical protein
MKSWKKSMAVIAYKQKIQNILFRKTDAGISGHTFRNVQIIFFAL